GDAGRWVPEEVSAGCVAVAGPDFSRQRLELPHHHIVVFSTCAQLKYSDAVDGKAAPFVKPLCASVFLIDAQPYAAGAPFDGGGQRGVHHCRRYARAVMIRQHIHLRQLNGWSNTHGALYLRIVADTANQHGVTDNPIVVAEIGRAS